MQGKRSQLYRHVFSTPDGERVLADICKLGHVTTSTYVKGDPQRSSMNEGARNLCLLILQLARIDPQSMAERLQQSPPTVDDF